MPQRHLASGPHPPHQPPPAPSAGATTPTTPDGDENASECKFRLTYQNTYRLDPKQPWVEERVLATLKEAMHEHLDSVEYDPVKCASLAGTVASDVRSRVRQLNFDRYKIVCIVEICEKLFQGLKSEARFLWDTQRDHYISYTVSNTHIVALGTVFGVYHE